MRRYFIALICLFLLVLQGMAMSLLPSNLVYSDLLMTPHWILGFLILIAIFYDRDDTYYSVWHALLFGLLVDVVYTGVLGVYMVTYGIVTYIIHRLNQSVHAGLVSASLLTIVGIALADTILYIIYSFVSITSMTWGNYAWLRLLPTLAANMIFFILLYPLVKDRISSWSEDINNA
ncbi:rod shape-determining protein MreD [Halobacillus yeomjeoni]|uniref:Rod shape-determining protein MreD n=1 Tax=Halobacillus yeomjeoni TaxID=311194 RepID=A0A931HV59_9BACI|nr:rod shape-determining protein MreD [Halobacillus yeomjeoni]MBH0230016.1 rod shape-determining protein MreD [Halobacillus yeomjeoni]